MNKLASDQYAICMLGTSIDRKDNLTLEDMHKYEVVIVCENGRDDALIIKNRFGSNRTKISLASLRTCLTQVFGAF